MEINLWDASKTTHECQNNCSNECLFRGFRSRSVIGLSDVSEERTASILLVSEFGSGRSLSDCEEESMSIIWGGWRISGQ